LESITSRKQKTTNPDHQTGKKKKEKKRKESMSKKLEREFAS
jgi:hypothetical protein